MTFSRLLSYVFATNGTNVLRKFQLFTHENRPRKADLAPKLGLGWYTLFPSFLSLSSCTATLSYGYHILSFSPILCHTFSTTPFHLILYRLITCVWYSRFWRFLTIQSHMFSSGRTPSSAVEAVFLVLSEYSIFPFSHLCFFHLLCGLRVCSSYFSHSFFIWYSHLSEHVS